MKVTNRGLINCLRSLPVKRNGTHQNNRQYPVIMNFTVAPCINNIKHFIVQQMHTNYKTLRLLK